MYQIIDRSSDAFSFNAGPVWFSQIWQEALRIEGIAPYKGIFLELRLWACNNLVGFAGFLRCMFSCWEVV
jgi:hypothetical protein